MARATNPVPTSELVPVGDVIVRLGVSEVLVRQRIDPADIHERWDHVECLSAERARELLDTLGPEKRERDDAAFAERERQMDAEMEARLWPLRAFEIAQERNRLPHTQAFGPGDPEPAWANAPSVEPEDADA